MTIYKLIVLDNNEWVDTHERGTKEELLMLMDSCPRLYKNISYKFVKCKDQSPIDRSQEFIDLLNNVVRQ